MSEKEDPRKGKDAADNDSGNSYGNVCSEEVSPENSSEESSSESSSSSRENQTEEEEEEDEEKEAEVLVVAGCKACYMYFMVPKLVKDCPKCAAQLLHI